MVGADNIVCTCMYMLCTSACTLYSCFELVQTVDTGDVMPVSMETTHIHNHLCE